MNLPPPTAPLEGAIPQTFDGFRLERLLGSGGMSDVYLAWDTALDRPVAIKFLRHEQRSAGSRQRLLTEARAIARLSHPNVVGVFRVGEAGSRPYIAYEYMPGQTLDQLPRPLPWRRALELGLGITRGIAAAHRQGILHRDIKPANVMLDATGTPRVLDFGLAKFTADAGKSSRPPPPSATPAHGSPSAVPPPEATTLTSDPPPPPRPLLPLGYGTVTLDHVQESYDLTRTDPGALVGTPLYLAPELWLGDTATPRSEVYSLGLLLYELFAGELPRTSEAGPLALMFLAHSQELPSLRGPCPDLPEVVVEVVEQCIRRRPEERYADAEAVRDALEAAITVCAVPAAVQSTSLNTHDESLVFSSFGRIAGSDLSRRFYHLLFERYAALRGKFPARMEHQEETFHASVALVVEHLQRPETLVPLLEDLGRRHAHLGLEPQHFDRFGDALLDTIAELDAEHWTTELAWAWSRAYTLVASSMQRGITRAARAHDEGGEAQDSVAPMPRWAHTPGGHVAWQVLGIGPASVVYLRPPPTQLAAAWRHPDFARLVRDLAAHAQVILFDPRGCGLSERSPPEFTLESRGDDLLAVLDAAEVDRAVLLAEGAALPTAVLFAATHPERTRGLVVFNGTPRPSRAPDWPHGLPWDELPSPTEEIAAMAPGRADDHGFVRWWTQQRESAVDAAGMAALAAVDAQSDVRRFIGLVQCPVRIVHRRGNSVVPAAVARWLADRLPHSELLEVPGTDHLPYVGDASALLRSLLSVLDEHPHNADSPAAGLATVMVLGPHDGDFSAAHETFAREAGAERGTALAGEDEAGLATVAVFDGALRALRAALAIETALETQGVRAAVVLHAGGVGYGATSADSHAVRSAMYLAGRAAPGVWATAAVRALAVGAALRFEAGRDEGDPTEDALLRVSLAPR